jgi:hypothetical protein
VRFEISHVEERLSDIRTHYDKLAARLAEPVAGIDADALAAERRSLPNRRRKKHVFQIGWLVARIRVSSWTGAAKPIRKVLLFHFVSSCTNVGKRDGRAERGCVTCHSPTHP